MDLILWRHAEARQAADGEDDLARPLTPKGERQARRMAHWLNQVLPATARILVSPAVRTQQTAQALDRRFKTCAPLAPDGTVDSLLDAARWPDSREPVLVVGHQPVLGLAARRLLMGSAQEPLRIKKGGVWWFRVRDEAQGPQLTLITVRSPDLH
ncbi:phosphohistidine phosphatase SixA [Ideonella sp. BN130291]|uniref:phosphohistidine phosphatase SixA n=1 Tax=Ideonella sp. BN130291 TaxID=3112940 RepID=UPI002E25E35A|nr:phosphohistidine phosphatase SixA [Ideonella sp. BN130291]